MNVSDIWLMFVACNTSVKTENASLNWISHHYSDVIMTTMTSQITSLTVVYSIVYSDADQRKHQSSASLPFVRGIHRGPVNSPHKWPVTRKIFPFDDVIMTVRSGNGLSPVQPQASHELLHTFEMSVILSRLQCVKCVIIVQLYILNLEIDIFDWVRPWFPGSIKIKKRHFNS